MNEGGVAEFAESRNWAGWLGDGDFGTDADIESFFRVLGGGNC